MMVYWYTKPRGPVAAMFTGPGPSYGLPGLTGRSNHDPCSRFVKAPAYHFGSRSLGDEQTAGPGPCYLPQPKVGTINDASHSLPLVFSECYLLTLHTVMISRTKLS